MNLQPAAEPDPARRPRELAARPAPRTHTVVHLPPPRERSEPREFVPYGLMIPYF